MSILITGGSGFLGSALTHQFLAEGNEVTWASRSVTTSHPDNVKIITYEKLRKIAELFTDCDTVFIEIFYKKTDIEQAKINHHRYSEASAKIMR